MANVARTPAAIIPGKTKDHARELGLVILVSWILFIIFANGFEVKRVCVCCHQFLTSSRSNYRRETLPEDQGSITSFESTTLNAVRDAETLLVDLGSSEGDARDGVYAGWKVI